MMVMEGSAVRRAVRGGLITGTTAGLAPGYLQGNIVILPAAKAGTFAAFCRRNHQSCPLLATSRPGDPALPTLGDDLDIRRDLPGYRVFRDGVASAVERSERAEGWGTYAGASSTGGPDRSAPPNGAAAATPEAKIAGGND